MNDKIVEAVVALNGDYKNVNNSPVWDRVDGACSIFLDDQGYWLTLSVFESLLNCERTKIGDLTPICTVAEFEEAAAKWRANQPKPQEANPDVITFELESGKHAIKMADGIFGIVLGKYVVYDDGYDTIDTVKDRIVEVVLLSVAPDDEYFYPQLGSGFTGIFEECDNLHSVWKKKPIKTPQQLEIERLQKLLADTKDELDRLTQSDTGGLNG